MSSLFFAGVPLPYENILIVHFVFVDRVKLILFVDFVHFLQKKRLVPIAADG